MAVASEERKAWREAVPKLPWGRASLPHTASWEGNRSLFEDYKLKSALKTSERKTNDECRENWGMEERSHFERANSGSDRHSTGAKRMFSS